MTGTIGVTIDVTEGLQARRALAESESRFRLLMEHSNDVLCELREGRVSYISPNCVEISGHPPEYYVGRSAADLVHPDDLPRLLTFLAPGWVGHITTTFRIQSADGDWRWREADGARIIDDAGKHRAVFVLRDIDARHRSEDALRRGQDRSDALLAAIPDLMFRLDRAGRYLDFHAEHDNDLYVPGATLIGSFVRDVLPPELAERSLTLIKQALDEGGVHSLEYSLVKRGDLRDYEARFVAAGDDEVVVIARDTTDRKRADRELGDSERKYRMLIEGARDVVYTHDVTGKLTSVNPMASVVYGYTTDELLGMNFAQIVDPAYLPSAIENMQRAFRGEPMLAPLEFLTYAKDGSPRWVEVSADPIATEGEVTGFQGIVRDIGGRKDAERRIAFQAGLLDVIDQAVSVTDAVGTITHWNRAAERMYGYAADDALGKSIIALRLAEPEAGRAMWRDLTTRRSWSGEVQSRRRDGSVFPSLVFMKAIFDGATLQGFMGVSADISELKRAEDEVRNAGEHAALLDDRTRIAHELHDNVAQYFFSIGLASKTVPRETTASLRKRLESVRSLASRGGAEIREAIFALSPPQEACEPGIRALVETLKLDGIQGSCNVQGDVAHLPEWSSELLYAATRECLFNVRKHAHATHVHVELVRREDRVTLTIRDDGDGEIDAIERKRRVGGGAGLRLLQGRFEQRGGALRIAERGRAGVCVELTLPLVESAA